MTLFKYLVGEEVGPGERHILKRNVDAIRNAFVAVTNWLKFIR